MSNVGVNANISQIPQPMADVRSLVYVCQLVKQALDSLAGFRGDVNNRAVTFNDLVTYGFVTAAELGSATVTTTPTGLAAEIIARQAGDVANSDAIGAETTRATAAEGTLTTNLATETTRATAAEALLTPLTTANVGQYVGTATNDNATAGNIGEVIGSNIVVGSAVTLTTATAKTVTSISLTAGDWDVTGEVWVSVGTGGATLLQTSINTATDTLSSGSAIGTSRAQLAATLTASFTNILSLRPCRVSLAGTTTYYLVASATFPSGTTTAYGNIIARRAR